jgi:Heavy-metal-associated domain
MLSKGKYLGFLIITFLLLSACGNKRGNAKSQKKIEITVTGLDGNGIAEKKITDDLMRLEGVKTISFNYLNNQVVVLFDTTVVSQSTIITRILQSNEGKHKVLDVQQNKEPLKKEPVIKPDPQEDIHDDTEDQYRDNG